MSDGGATKSETPNNPTAIAWYVEQAQRLLEDQQRRAESLRTRAGQLAGFGAAVLALLGANARGMLHAVDGCAQSVAAISVLAASALLVAAVVTAIVGAFRPRLFAAISADEVANYTSDRFLREPDLWRVQVRTLRALYEATSTAQDGGNTAAKARSYAPSGSLWSASVSRS